MTKRIRDIPISEVRVGLRVRSLFDYNKIGTIVKIDPKDDDYAWIRWDGETSLYSGFYNNGSCWCEIVEDE